MSIGYDRYLDFQYGRSGDFVTALFRTIARADNKNLAKLAKGFPNEVEAYKCWTRIGVPEFVKNVTEKHHLLPTLVKEYGLEEAKNVVA